MLRLYRQSCKYTAISSPNQSWMNAVSVHHSWRVFWPVICLSKHKCDQMLERGSLTSLFALQRDCGTVILSVIIAISLWLNLYDMAAFLPVSLQTSLKMNYNNVSFIFKVNVLIMMFTFVALPSLCFQCETFMAKRRCSILEKTRFWKWTWDSWRMMHYLF